MSKGKINWRSFAGKGYYIALILCVAAIGITGYLYYRNSNEDAQPVVNAGVQGQEQPHTGATPSEGSDPADAATMRLPLKTGLPLSGETIMGYAMDCLSYNATTRDWRVHDGIDIAAETGSAVCAAAAGEVYTVYEDEAMGTTVVLRHQGDYVTTYSSLDETLEVEAGDTVKLGQTIGYVGRSAALETAIGEHVHFSVRCKDEPVDPAEFLNLE
jgi:murein DD-endopeptidase MepM/ murein hydrolase activator NlpD